MLRASSVINDQCSTIEGILTGFRNNWNTFPLFVKRSKGSPSYFRWLEKN